MTDFTLDPRLEADSAFVTDLAICQVRLMTDARFAWCLAVPRRDGLVELEDLSAEDRAAVMEEAMRLAGAIRAVAPVDKMNVAALGNQVKQLHIHVIGRTEGDPAWPGPVWGVGQAEGYTKTELQDRIAGLRGALGA